VTLTVRLFLMMAAAAATGCGEQQGIDASPHRGEPTEAAGIYQRPVIYQVFTRLFGNKNTTNRPWGTIEENGAGKFADIDSVALDSIRDLGITHVWYTGVLHHALVGDYAEYGIATDDPDVVKGRAGSPYAIRDYYDVNPDLALDLSKRLEEFSALVERTHSAGMKVIIDIVPNHVARAYHSTSAPDGIESFGESDDTTVEYRRDNNFYYIPGEPFRVPEWPAGYLPLGGRPHPMVDGRFDEFPARWTGNGARSPQPAADDWYETVKINFGIRPDGQYDFDALPPGYARRDHSEHADFWSERDVPDSWIKFRDIALYWLGQGVDGFRYDMAEMVPVEFWSYLNSSIKMARPDALLLAEVYNPAVYRDYLYRGRMDYLYDKVGTYDALRAVVEGRSAVDSLVDVVESLRDIDGRMLRFLENHDEQRVASAAFARDPVRAMPAMTVTATVGSGPVMIYFGQEVGEPGDGDAGFGDPTRTTIFDYWGVPSHQRWMNDGRFDGGRLSASEAALRSYYARLLGLAGSNPAFTGAYADLYRFNRSKGRIDDRTVAYARWRGADRIVVIASFSAERRDDLVLEIPASLLADWGVGDGTHPMRDLLSGDNGFELTIRQGEGRLMFDLPPYGSYLLALP